MNRARNASTGPLIRLLPGLCATSTLKTDLGAETLYLHPGQMHVCVGPAVVTTILGSCVSVCLNDPLHCVGGMNHFLLAGDSGPEAAPGRYGPAATRALIQRVIAKGAVHAMLEARIVGGANVLAAFRHHEQHLGRMNVLAARAALDEAGIPVVAEDVGGVHGRKVSFSLGDGETIVRLVRP